MPDKLQRFADFLLNKLVDWANPPQHVDFEDLPHNVKVQINPDYILTEKEKELKNKQAWTDLQATHLHLFKRKL
jgi:hypothetical protein